MPFLRKMSSCIVIPLKKKKNKIKSRKNSYKQYLFFPQTSQFLSETFSPMNNNNNNYYYI